MGRLLRVLGVQRPHPLRCLSPRSPLALHALPFAASEQSSLEQSCLEQSCLSSSWHLLTFNSVPCPPSLSLPFCPAGEYIAVEFLEQQYSSSDLVEQVHCPVYRWSRLLGPFIAGVAHTGWGWGLPWVAWLEHSNISP